ncbi:hypothetical protein IFR05_017600, partial [Cadophora sp. M221]
LGKLCFRVVSTARKVRDSGRNAFKILGSWVGRVATATMAVKVPGAPFVSAAAPAPAGPAAAVGSSSAGRNRRRNDSTEVAPPAKRHRR